MYPRQIHSKDMKHGGTPLHWAMSIDVIRAYVEVIVASSHVDVSHFTFLFTLNVGGGSFG